MKSFAFSLSIAGLLFGAAVSCGDDDPAPSTTSGAAGSETDVTFGGDGDGTASGGNTSGNGGNSNTPSGGSTDQGTDGSSDDPTPPNGGSGSVDPSNEDGGSELDAAMSGANGGANGGPNGTQPLGGLCTNDQHCSQAQGSAVCCVSDGCTNPCECALEADCPDGNFYLQCANADDCAQYGGGKICCEVEVGSDVMRYCTKQSACAGTVLE